MPLYEIHHSTPLSGPQRDALAQSITYTHTRKFTVPSLFVNVRFIDTSQEKNYIGGKEQAINRIVCYVRAGGTRTADDFNDLALKLQDIWDKTVNSERSKEKALNRVFVMGAITAGVENGFLLPKASEDVDWLQQNYPKFQELAAAGDNDFVGLVNEFNERDDPKAA
ncbi:hypothetical protein BDV18DRAFT_129775 [Aspergillus unguis]